MQTYKCCDCGYKFQNNRKGNKLNRKILKEYIWERQTLKGLSKKYGKGKRWIQHRLDENNIKSVVRIKRKEVVLVVDTTFFKRTFGVVVFRDPKQKKNVWWTFTNNESADIYAYGKKHLEDNGFVIKAIVLDGKPGIREVFSDIPIQMCYFHQKQIIKRYLTNKPKLEASKELKQITKTLTKTNKEVFEKELNIWFLKWKEFLKERTIDYETNKWFYTHKRLRSAYRSLKNNLNYLFTYQEHKELYIPNTTNSLDGFFSQFKARINVHRGLRIDRKKRMIIEILKGESD